ncbi:MAG: 4-(cytidine 5'-diphospho)-2-C-methyl-D-erythritol kinase [Muribaculaceae bacterium]|nr:4-(cytidine 5'-diphospho)-2-C-methyl-D-erythritol kinase [Muribaculaceae bacterium]
MILFPNCKINLGLHILARRPDGYHDIETVMVPVDLTDILEIVPAANGETTLTVTGNHVDCPPEKNLVIKALHAVEKFVNRQLPVNIYLRKIIPDGAGLGGGSSDAAFTIKGLNSIFDLGLTDQQMASIASTVGADCPFFIYNQPMLATGTGTTLSPVQLTPDFKNLTCLIVKPTEGVSTAEAYAGVTPQQRESSLADFVNQSVTNWQSTLFNDFEKSVFEKRPEIANVKQHLINSGPIYVAMSGSGSSVFALFENDKMADDFAKSITNRFCQKVKLL